MQNLTRLTFILADDHPVIRNGIGGFLKVFYPNLEVDEVDNGEQLVQAVKAKQYDIIFTDISMPVMNGIEATRQIIEYNKNAKIIGLSMNDSERTVISMFENGASGYLLKSAGKEEYFKAIEDVLAGKMFLNENFLNSIMWSQLKKRSNKEQGLPSDREMEVLALICKGFATKEIAEQLFLSPKTVDNHRTRLLEKANANNTATLIMYAVRSGWV
jgi:DNA-binding NarL/FixJ family response regulator